MAMPTKENIGDAASIMERLASENGCVPAMKWMVEYCENVLEAYKKATEWYKKATSQEV